MANVANLLRICIHYNKMVTLGSHIIQDLVQIGPSDPYAILYFPKKLVQLIVRY